MFLVLALLSVGVVNFCALSSYSFGNVSTAPIDEQIHEQLLLPGMAPYDVVVTNPWGGIAANAILGILLAMSVLFALWNLSNVILSFRSNRTIVFHTRLMEQLQRAAVWVLLIFWLSGCALFTAFLIVLRAASHGIPPFE
jgi:hypothetical protein